MKPDRPHILFITTDQQRGDGLGSAGHPCLRTPHLDLLATEGVRFDRAYADCPVCIPARTTMITGLHAHRYGMPNYAASHRIRRDRELFLGRLLTRAGYQTQLVGKTHWHLDPDDRGGFEHVLGYAALDRECARRAGDRPREGIGRNECSPALSFVPPQLHSTNWAVDRCLEFLEDRERRTPFFLWASFIDPHPPTVIHEPYYSMYDGEEIPPPVRPAWAEGDGAPFAIRALRAGNAHAHLTPRAARKVRGVYYGQITNIDHQLGRLFGALMRRGLWDDTVVVFTSDHGEHLGDYGTYFKSTFLDPVARVPFLVRAPKGLGLARGASTRALVEHADLLPTFCELAGVEAPGDVSGTSLLPLLRGETSCAHGHLHGQIGAQHLFHDGRYKYLYFCDDGRELVFDKDADPMDECDLSGDAALTARLRGAFVEHLAAEGHADLRDGRLRNEGRTALTDDIRTNVIGWMGLGAME
jgi:arylsulfatase A-like enzyme